MRDRNWDEILYCTECGNIDVQVMAWVNANTDEYISDVNTPPERSDCWCDYCEDNCRLATISELWNDFASMKFDFRGETTSKFLSFPAGTPATDVLAWFKERIPADIFENLTKKPEIIDLRPI